MHFTFSKHASRSSALLFRFFFLSLFLFLLELPSETAFLEGTSNSPLFRLLSVCWYFLFFLLLSFFVFYPEVCNGHLDNFWKGKKKRGKRFYGIPWMGPSVLLRSEQQKKTILKLLTSEELRKKKRWYARQLRHAATIKHKQQDSERKKKRRLRRRSETHILR